VQKAHDLSLVQDRFEVIFRRFGVEITGQTMCGWMRRSAELLEPLYLRLKQFVRSFVASCGLAKVDPFVWIIQDVLTRIGACSIQLLDALLPHRWAAAHSISHIIARCFRVQNFDRADNFGDRFHFLERRWGPLSAWPTNRAEPRFLISDL